MMQNYEYFFPKYYRVYLQNLGLGCPVGETASEEKRRMRFCTKASSSSGQKHFSFRQFQSRSWGVDVGCDRRRWVFFSGPESVLKCNFCSCQGMERKREKNTHKYKIKDVLFARNSVLPKGQVKIFVQNPKQVKFVYFELHCKYLIR